jgi:hypothetical protein
MRDFTLKTYRELLLALKEAGYSFYTFEEWCIEKPKGSFIILRHDVDLKAENSLATAEIESEMSIRATYYFRVVPQSNQPEIIRSIVNLSHEIGYHYEDLSLFKGNNEKSINHFEQQLAYFRQFYPVRTICMHGSPVSKWDNRDIWKKYDYHNYGIIGEPYFDFLSPFSLKRNTGDEIFYFTDTGRMWDGDKFNVRDKVKYSSKQQAASSKQSDNVAKNDIHTTFDLISWLKNNPTHSMMITTHPQRWTNNHMEWTQEFIMQNIKNFFKQFII